MYILLLDFGFSVELKVFSQRGLTRSTNNTMAMFSRKAFTSGRLNHKDPRTGFPCGASAGKTEVVVVGIASRLRVQSSAG